MALINMPANAATQQAMNTGTGNAALPAGTNLSQGASSPFASLVGGALGGAGGSSGDLSSLMQALKKAKIAQSGAPRLPGTVVSQPNEGPPALNLGQPPAPTSP